MQFTDLPFAISPLAPGSYNLVLYTILVLLCIALLLFLAGRLGERNQGTEKDRAYECGIIPKDSNRHPIPVPFYLIALFFLVFDIESAFIFSWAIALRTLGWLGWLQITFFIAVLLASLIYIWAKGGLEWRKQDTR